LKTGSTKENNEEELFKDFGLELEFEDSVMTQATDAAPEKPEKHAPEPEIQAGLSS